MRINGAENAVLRTTNNVDKSHYLSCSTSPAFDATRDVRIDGPEKMNTISGDFRQEIEDIWSGQIADDPSVKAVVFISGKPDNYIAGADIRMISATEDKADLKQVRRQLVGGSVCERGEVPTKS